VETLKPLTFCSRVVTKYVPHFNLKKPPPPLFPTKRIYLIRKLILRILRDYLPNYINPTVVYWRLFIVKQEVVYVNYLNVAPCFIFVKDLL